jgi:hypothetical protein
LIFYLFISSKNPFEFKLFILELHLLYEKKFGGGEKINKKNKIIYLGLVVTVSVLLCLQVGAVNIVKTKKETSNTLLNRNSAVFQNARRIPFEITNLGHSGRSASLNGNVLVSVDSPEDDQWPAITRDQNGNIVVTWTHLPSPIEANIGLAYSQDGGENWNAILIVLDGVPMFSDVAYVHGADFEGGGDFTGLWGVYGDVLENHPGFYRISDISNPDTYEFYYWMSQYPDISYCAISDHTWYNEFNYDITGPTNMYIMDAPSGWDIDMCPWHWYVDGAVEEGGVGYFDAQLGPPGLKTAPAFDPDMACLHDADPAQTEDDYVLLTWHHNNQTTGKSEIVFKKIVPNIEPDIEYTPYQFYLAKGDTFDAAHPNIGASGSNAVIVYMTNDNVFGDWDIKCAYSSDDGTTWEISTVANEPQVDELYPAVYMSGNKAYCAYIRQGNLYLVESEDGGATWGEPTQINDVDGTVVAEENSVDIHPAGIVWTDNRNGNKDIYFASVAAAPAISIKSISGGFGISAIIENLGTAAATDVSWAIDLQGLVFPKHKEGVIPTLEAGASETVKTGFIFGIGSITITVTADGATKTATGKIIGPLVVGVK